MSSARSFSRIAILLAGSLGSTLFLREGSAEPDAGVQAAPSTTAALDPAVVAALASATPRPPGSASPAPPVVPDESLCVEQLPAGKARPKMTERFPDHALAGHATWLEVEVEHGEAETVMPGGARIQLGSEQVGILERSGFILPDPEGPTHSSVERKTQGQSFVTKVRIPFVALPKKPGRPTFTLPPLPIVIARASGESITLCTRPHSATIDDPTASTPNAMPRPNPRLLEQREEWTSLKVGLMVALLAILVGLLLAMGWHWWKKRERRPRPGPPPRPPWEVAFEELSQVRADNLIAQGRLGEHFDRVSDTVRKYLGSRFGFDGLESTTTETMKHLRRAQLETALLTSIDILLAESDLVKFARRTPTETECLVILDRADATVRSTLPRQEPPMPTDSPSSSDAEVRP